MCCSGSRAVDAGRMLKFPIMAAELPKFARNSHRSRLRAVHILLLLFLAAAVPPAHATRHITVAQLEKTLASSVAKHRPDDELVRVFADFDLTERLTDASRNRITTGLHLGPQTTLALQLLADKSSVLDPPPAELPAGAAPDKASADRILEAARNYVSQTLPHLPDFLATRTTYTFNDTAQIFKVNEWPVRAGLHLVGSSSREITFRDDHEVEGAPAKPANTEISAVVPAVPKGVRTSAPLPAGSVRHATERGLLSFGEFGTLLGIIFVDAAHGSVGFHHWEQTPAGSLAVFHYAVPRAESHYSVNYCCLFDGLRTSVRQGGGRRGGAVNGTQQGQATLLFHKVPAYHGSVFIDPASGVVRRVTLEAEMGDGPVSRAATVIEYGPVVMGDRRFICPLRSMNIYEGPPESGPQASELPSTVTPSLLPTGTLYVNETSFTDYHRLGSSVRILPEADTRPDERQ